MSHTRRTRLGRVLSCVPALLAAMAVGCAEPTFSDCAVTIDDININGNTMTADGHFTSAQPLLVAKMGAVTQIIPGIETGGDHATFDLTGLAPGNWAYSFDASCFDENATAHVDAPTGIFTR